MAHNPNDEPKPDVVQDDVQQTLFPMENTSGQDQTSEGVGVSSERPDEPDQEVTESDDATESSKGSRFRKVVAAGAAVVALVAVAGLARGCGPDDDQDPRTKGGLEMCDDFDNAHAANNSSDYVSTAFLPKGEVNDDEASKKIVERWFNENGPLAGKGDYASMAVVMSAIAQPAQQGNVADPNYSYKAAFDRNIARYNGEDGTKVAQDDCRDAWNVLGQVAGYDQQALQKGVTVTKFKANREKDTNNITGFTLAKYVPTENIAGTVFKLRNTSKELNAFNAIIVDQDGNMYVSGYTEAPTQPKDGEIEVGVNPTDTDVTIDVAPQPDTNSDNSANSDTTGTGLSGTVPSGTVPSGTVPTHTTTPKPTHTITPQPTPTTTRPPVTVPPTVPPKPTPTTTPKPTPTTTPKPTPTTTPTTQPKGPEVTIPGAPN